MKILKSVTIFFLLTYSVLILSSEHQVIVLGRSLRDTDKQEYIRSTLNLIEAAHKDQKRVFIAAPDELKKHFIKWPNVFFQKVENGRQLNKFMKKVGSLKLPSLKMTLYSHGLSSNSEVKPGNTQVLLNNERVSINRLNKIINKNIKQSSRLQIVAPFCHSGAIHQIAHSRRNTCSAAASDYKTVSLSEVDCFGHDCEVNTSWGIRMSESELSPHHGSLADAHEYSQNDGALNEYRGQLSSIDFLQKKFEIGPYDIESNFLSRLFSSGIEGTREADFLAERCHGVKSLYDINNTKIQKLIGEVEKALMSFDADDVFVASVPDMIKINFEEKMEKYLSEYPNLVLDFIELYQRGKQAHALLKSGRIQSEYDAIYLADLMKKRGRLKSNRLFKYYSFLKEINLINRLYRSGKRKDIQKFEDMYICEIN